jgi:hypothetical protein
MTHRTTILSPWSSQEFLLLMEEGQMCLFSCKTNQDFPRPEVEALGGSSGLAFKNTFKEGKECSSRELLMI